MAFEPSAPLCDTMLEWRGCHALKPSSASFSVSLADSALVYAGRSSPGTMGVSSSKLMSWRAWVASRICFSARSMTAAVWMS
jgi:hypothetical protein